MNKDNPKQDPLKVLGVIRRLEVGPVELKPRVMSAPYRVTREGEVHENELIYRFEEDVFGAAGDRPVERPFLGCHGKDG